MEAERHTVVPPPLLLRACCVLVRGAMPPGAPDTRSQDWPGMRARGRRTRIGRIERYCEEVT